MEITTTELEPANTTHAAAAEDIIVCRNLSKRYVMGGQNVHALRDANFSVRRGEFVAVLGPSGSGKSTCMNLMGCLDSPSGGQLFLEGRDVSAMSRDRLAKIRSEKIGFVFQQFNLLARTTALDNVILPLLYTPTPRAQHRARAMMCLESVGLANRSDHHPAQLSGGQQQRVAIARALVNEPVIILADEPTGALDTRTSIEVMALFQKLNAQGITIVLVTHEPEVAEAAGRQLHFRDGRLQEDKINPAPRDMRVAARSFSAMET
ncbi:ABC transporter ATP-binding protein [Gilvimarinus sp. F26214L]|uniref:ABC transporter ATP-binding protein n=1 Tax=Gilvimarinus sp. DZF01 TaxID=3461371 RepID=UPI004045AE5B